MLSLQAVLVSFYNHTLYLGYEGAIVANLEESSHELMEALASTTQGMQYHCYSNHQKDWFTIVHPTPQSEDLLSELPNVTDPIQYQDPAKTASLQSNPFFTYLGYDLPSCKVQIPP